MHYERNSAIIFGQYINEDGLIYYYTTLLLLQYTGSRKYWNIYKKNFNQ